MVQPAGRLSAFITRTFRSNSKKGLPLDHGSLPKNRGTLFVKKLSESLDAAKSLWRVPLRKTGVDTSSSMCK
eukprot:g59.t1